MNCQQYVSLIGCVLLIHPGVQGGEMNEAGSGTVNVSRFSPVSKNVRTPMAIAVHRGATPLRLRSSQAAGVSSQKEALIGQVSTLLPDGRILLTGGENDAGPVSDAYIKDAKTAEASKLNSQPLQPRVNHTATVLPDGRVLIFGGITQDNRVLAESELFDPTSGSFQVFASHLEGRAHHTATLLPDGRLLIIGGMDADGNTLDTLEFWDYRTQSVQPFPAALLSPRQDHTAVLRNDGTVRIHGGSSGAGSTPTSDEIIDPTAGTIEVAPTGAKEQPGRNSHVVQSTPVEGASDVPIDSIISVQFSSAVQVQTVTGENVVLAAKGQPVPASVVAAESGVLAFLTPNAPLQPGTEYTLSVVGVEDRQGSEVASFQISFTTAQAAENSSAANPGSTAASETSSKVADATTGGRQAGDDPPVTRLQATPGVTALSGDTRTTAGKYLPNVTFHLDCDGKKGTATSDSLGRFLILTSGSGHCELEIDGTTAHRNGEDYGRFFPGVDLIGGQTNILPYTVWMTPIDHAHEIAIPSPTASEVVVTAPHLKGLELHLPPGTVLRDYNGQVLTRIGMTRIPIRRPPFPLPNNVPVPVYFTIQPGGAFVEVGGSRYTNGKGAQLIYPNTHRAPAGMSFNFWDYDPDGQGWYSYGTGHVSKNRRNIVPDPGVVIHRFTGAMVASPDTAPPEGGLFPFLAFMSNTFPGLFGMFPGMFGGGGPFGPGNPNGGTPNGPSPFPQAGDPIDPSTGLFIYHVTDYVLPDVIPGVLSRTYRQGDPVSRAFGVGTSQDLDMFLIGDFHTYQYADLITADGSRIHYTRTSPGSFWGSAVFVNNTNNTGFYGSTLRWAQDGYWGWELTLRNGAVLYFPEAAGATNPLSSALGKLKDRYGNTLALTRNSTTGVLTKATTPNGRFLALTYDGNGRVIQAQDNLGRTTAYLYDAGGRLVQVTDPAAGITKYTYDANDQMLTITDSRNNTVLTNQYNPDGRVAQQTQADNGQFIFAYTEDVNGNITQTQVTDPRGNSRILSFGQSGYFSGGNLISEMRAVGKPEQQAFAYNWQPQTLLLQSIVDPLNRTTSFAYDNNGNLAGTTLLSGTGNAVTISATYDPTFNEITSVTDPLTRTVNFSYDSAGNLTTIRRPLNLIVTNTFNSQGQLRSSTPTGAGSVTVNYIAGLPSAVIDALSDRVSSTLDSLGRVTELTDALGNTTQYQYDADNRIVNATDALQNQTQFSYDSNGNLLSVTDAGGGTTSFTYDKLNRLQTRTDPLQSTAYFTYDASGNLSTVTDRKHQTTQFTYDALNRPTQITYSDQSTINFTYDAGNRVMQAVDSNTGTTTYGYDQLGHLLSKSNSLGTVSYTYNGAGQRTSMTVAGQPTVSYTYDAAGRLSQVTQGSTNVTVGYDTAGRRSSLTLPNGVTTSYSYDAASRLIEIDYSNASRPLGSLTYQYDAAGRRIAIGGSLARTGLPGAISNASYNAANQLTQWNGSTLSYDNDGNLTNDGTSTYTWDARNQLASVSGPSLSASFVYDFSGQRIAKRINGSHYNYLFDGPNIVQEQSVGSITANLLTGFGIDENYTRTDASGSYSFLSDGLNSTLALTDSSGNLGAQYTYDPFGNTSQSSSSTNSFQFTGRENDGTALYYLRARYYSPTLQRFISQDPIGFAGGINLYAYAANSPIGFSDPLGTDPSGSSGHGVPAWLPFLPLLGMALGPEGFLAGEAAEGLLAAAEGGEAVGAAVEAAEEEAAVSGGSGPTFLGQENGPAIPVPEGASGPTPALNGQGAQWADGAGGNGLAGNVNGVRVMDPNSMNPDGYVNYGSTQADGGWQSVNPYTGQSVPRSSPWWHIPLGPLP